MKLIQTFRSPISYPELGPQLQFIKGPARAPRGPWTLEPPLDGAGALETELHRPETRGDRAPRRLAAALSIFKHLTEVVDGWELHAMIIELHYN